MDQVGALLAHFHAAAGQIRLTSKASGRELARGPRILFSRRLDAACPSPDLAAPIRRPAGRLAADLDACGQGAAARLIIHGDFANHNAAKPP